MTSKKQVAHLDFEKMSKEEIIEALELFDFICSHALMKVSDYGELGFMSRDNPTKHHITVDFNVWLNTSCFKRGKKELEHIEKVERFIKFINEHAYRVEPLNDEEFRKVLTPIIEKLKVMENGKDN